MSRKKIKKPQMFVIVFSAENQGLTQSQIKDCDIFGFCLFAKT